MRRIGLAAVLAALVLPACTSDGDPTASPSASTPAPGTSSPASSAPASPTSTLPAGCTAPAAAPAGATVVTATVSGGKITTASKRYDVELGSHVRVEVTTDTADEVHVHSYDVKATTKPGCPVALDFTARIPGSVEVELEKAHLHLFEVRAR